MKIFFNNFSKYMITSIVILLVGCNTLPPGIPPPPDTPIIVAPIVDNIELITGKDAVNYMLTSLATKCKPIYSSTSTPPTVLNHFIASKDNINDLPMELWLTLIKNNMITPVSNKKDIHLYILVSEIISVNNSVNDHKEYLWKLKLIDSKKENNITNTIWNTQFKFAHHLNSNNK